MGKTIAMNKKAKFDYEFIDIYEAGIVLLGSEVKAIRAGRVNLKDSYCRFIKGELWLLNAHISYLDTTNPHFKPDTTRVRKLLMHQSELVKIQTKVDRGGLTIVPISIYFNKKNICKLKIAVARGKKLHDKRESLKKKTLEREAKQALKNF
ncbi:MAG: SsrA-binding protein SmpB [Campylobacterota bacterium]